MSIHVALNHVTHYRYDRPIMIGPQVVRLRPAPHARTPVLAYSQRVTPAKHFVNWQQDPQSNWLARLVFPEPVRELKIEVDLVAEMSVINPFDFFLEPRADKFPFRYEESQLHELAPYLVRGALSPRFKRYLDAVPRAAKPTVDFLVDLNLNLSKAIRYIVRMEPGVQTPEETLALASGSCRDSGWLLVQLLRHLGVAARFVSGYLIQLKPDVKSLDGPSGTEVDFTDLHAWCEAYLPGAGWVGLDPTSGLFAGEGHIPLACSPEPGSAAPISGATEKSEVEFSHAMRVDRVWEAPRVTKPYTDEQWAAIDALGGRVDADLAARDVRLTMGGEPTFVSVDDRQGAEWNTEAMGPNKRKLGYSLLKKLKEKYAKTGLLHLGQGKWYPGEQLPRWSLSCYWRKDGEPGRGAVRGRKHRQPRDRRTGSAVPAHARAEARARSAIRVPGLRGHLVLPLARAPAAGQRRPLRCAAGRPAGTRTPAPRVQAGPGQGRRVRVPGIEEQRPVGHRALVPARRALLPDPG